MSNLVICFFMEKSISVIIPCYNEELTIINVIEEIHKTLLSAKIFVFDNNSTDSSAALVREKIVENLKTNADEWLYLYSVTEQGKGSVIRHAFEIVESDAVIMIDADSQYDVSVLPEMLSYFFENKLDMLNIAREVVDATVHRKGHGLGNAIFSFGASLLFGKKINDIFSGYRIFSKGFVKSFPSHSEGFEIETELTVFALQQRLAIAELPAAYYARPDGSFSKLSTFKDGFRILGTLLSLVVCERPLLVFGLFAFLCFAVAVILGVPIAIEFLQTGAVPRFPTAFVCVGLGVIGVLSSFAAIICALVVRGIKEARRFMYLRAGK